jgi:hypothetical protein
MTTIEYIEWHTLQSRGPVDPAPDEPVEGILLVGTKPALHFYGNESSYGEDSISIFPAIHDGKRCFVKREVWCPAGHYSASGTQEFIISFEAGVKIFLERGIFEFDLPQEADPKERIKQFFKGAIVNSISRDVEFCEYSDDGYIEVELIAPVNANMDSVHISFPLSGEIEEYDGSNAHPHAPSVRVLASREGREPRSPRLPRHV